MKHSCAGALKTGAARVYSTYSLREKQSRLPWTCAKTRITQLDRRYKLDSDWFNLLTSSFLKDQPTSWGETSCLSHAPSLIHHNSESFEIFSRLRALVTNVSFAALQPSTRSRRRLNTSRSSQLNRIRSSRTRKRPAELVQPYDFQCL